MQSTVLTLVNELRTSPILLYIGECLIATSNFYSVGEAIIPKAKLFFQYLFTPQSLTIIVDEKCGLTTNQVFDAVNAYLDAMIAPSAKLFRVSKTPQQNKLVLSVDKHTEIVDTYQRCNLKWKLHSGPSQGYSPRFFELTLKKKFKETVVKEYLPFVMDKAKEIMDNDKVVKLYTKNRSPYSEEGGWKGWVSINLDHPATFDTLAMEPEMKKDIIKDFESFKIGKEFYKKVGRVWRRAYLLYGPPGGTCKSSLIAAMANYLKFDIYYLEISNLINSDFLSTLVSTTNKSIIAIEDIDSRIKIQQNLPPSDIKWRLLDLMNFVNGLGSSCGDERIIVFTANNKDHLDPALLRPGLMDILIHLFYCTNNRFRQLSSNYLATSAGEQMTSENSNNALGGLVNCLKRKMNESNDVIEEQIGGQEAKRLKMGLIGEESCEKR